MLYSKSTNGFYLIEIHGKNIPSDVVEISFEEWQELLDKQSQGMQIVSNEDGFPVVTTPPEPITEQQPEQAPMV